MVEQSSSLEEISRMGEKVEEVLAPRFSPEGFGVGRPEETAAAAANLPPAHAAPAGPDDLRIKNFFFVARDNRVFMGATTVEQALELTIED